MNQTTVRLADLCDVVTDRVEPEEQPDAVYVGLKHLETGRFARKGEGRAAETKSSKSAFRAGDILYGKLGAYLDKAVLAEDEGICSTDILVVRSRQDVDPRFLLGVIHSPQFIEHAVAGTTGVSHPRTSWSHISGFQFPSYAQDEQKNIGDFLWLMHKALTASEAVVNAGQKLKYAAMENLFFCGLQNSIFDFKYSEKIRTIKSILETKLTDQSGYWKVSDYFIVRKKPLRFDLSEYDNVSFTPMKLMPQDGSYLPDYIFKSMNDISSGTYFEPGDVLVSKITPSFENGKQAIATNIPGEFGYASTEIIPLFSPESKYSSKLLFFYLLTPTVRNYISARMEGTTGRKRVPTDVILNLPLPYFDRNFQNEIADLFEAIQKIIHIHKEKQKIISNIMKKQLCNLFSIEVATLESNSDRK